MLCRMWIEDCDLAPPPRRVSPLATLEVMGGLLFQIGCGLVAFTSAFGWVFVGLADLSAWTRFSGALETAPGVLVSLEPTGAHVNNEPVVKHGYRFTGPDGVEREGASFQTGQAGSSGQTVTVEFPAGDPAISRIVGQRRALFSPWLSLLALLPLGSLTLAGFGLRTCLRRAWLLRHGRLTHAKLVAKEETGARINDEMVWKLTFTFQDDAGSAHQLSRRTHQPAELEDEADEGLLYDPARPERAELLGVLPGEGRTAPDGGWEALSSSRPLLKLLLPGLALAENVILAWFWL